MSELQWDGKPAGHDKNGQDGVKVTWHSRSGSLSLCTGRKCSLGADTVHEQCPIRIAKM